MSKCPFWSNSTERVNCYSACPMNPLNNKEEVCPFTEHLVTNKISYKEIVQDDYSLEEEDNYRAILSSYGKL